MTGSVLITLIAVLLGSTVAAALALVVNARLLGHRMPAIASHATPVTSGAVRRYHFLDGYLTSELTADDAFLSDRVTRAGAWSALSDVLARVNPRVPEFMDALHRGGKSFLLIGQAGADSLTISGATSGNGLQITIAHAQTEAGRIALDAASFGRERAEAELLKRTVDASPVAAWRQDAKGRIVWANATYLRYLEQHDPGHAGLHWPLAHLFGRDLAQLPEPGQTRRCGLAGAGRDQPIWFEVSTVSLGSETLVMALPAERLVAAEDALRDFVQTLSKTFADLPIGLAIFDRKRELVLFNPSMVTLSTLETQFLSSRPTLFSFLDALRENRHMPEPKNYRAWRESIAQLEADAADGTYHDLWTLPSGQTYRVIGRPHPDGAIAFMIEDISSEVSLTRQFRADLDLYQAVIDQNDAAVAVFSSQGQLVVSNAAYAELWGHDPREILGILSLREASAKWEAAMMPAPVWGEIRDFTDMRHERTTWTDTLTMPGRGTLHLRIAPLKGGATMLSFQLDHGAPIEPETEGDTQVIPQSDAPTVAE